MNFPTIDHDSPILQLTNRLIFSLRGGITHMRQVITPAFVVVPEATQGYINLTVLQQRT
jgi:hypothetical protein